MMPRRTNAGKPGTLSSPLPDPGVVICPVPPAATGIVEAVERQLVDLGFLPSAVPLAALHHHLNPDVVAFNEHYTNAVSRAFYALSDALLTTYRELIAHIAQNDLREDFLFQERPIIRFHFPVPFPDAMKSDSGLPRQLHSDLLGGHPPHMVQGWLALTNCAGSAALQCSSRDDGVALLDRYRATLGTDGPPFADSLHHFYDRWDSEKDFGEALTAACKPVTMKAGELLLFDPHCIHGGTENREETTRVSLDFRLLPVAFESETMKTATTDTGRRFRRGELFHARSAWEMS